jgi:hypothetical protein
MHYAMGAEHAEIVRHTLDSCSVKQLPSYMSKFDWQCDYVAGHTTCRSIK